MSLRYPASALFHHSPCPAASSQEVFEAGFAVGCLLLLLSHPIAVRRCRVSIDHAEGHGERGWLHHCQERRERTVGFVVDQYVVFGNPVLTDRNCL